MIFIGLVYTVPSRPTFHDGDLGVGLAIPNGIHPIEVDHNRILRLGCAGQASVTSNRHHSDIFGKTGARNRLNLFGIGWSGDGQGLPVINIGLIAVPSLCTLPLEQVCVPKYAPNLRQKLHKRLEGKKIGNRK